MSIKTLYEDEPFIARIEALFERHAAQTARCYIGGVSSHRGSDQPPPRRLTDQQRKQIARLSRTGKYSRNEVARLAGCAPKTVAVICRALGIEHTDQRARRSK